MFFTKKYKQLIENLQTQNAELSEEQGTMREAIDCFSARVPDIQKDIETLALKIKRLDEQAEKMDELLEDYENFSIEKTLAKKSNEPWAGISVAEVDNETGRVGIKVDFNDKFQEYLKRNGIPGNTDDERMSIWVTSLIKEWGEEIDEETAKRYREDI